jgi:hypothetical protein
VPAVQKVLSSLHSQFHIPRLSSSSVWNLCPPRCTFIGPTKWHSQGAKSGDIRRVVHDFSAHCCHCCLHQICGVWMSSHAAGWSPLTVSHVSSSESLGAHHCKASHCNTVQ